MKISLLYLFLAFVCISFAEEPTREGESMEPANPSRYGFSAMEHLEFLPCLAPNGVQTKQFADYDTTGDNNDGAFIGFKRYEENGEWVFFDEIGPGCLYRLQMNVFFGWSKLAVDRVRVRMYFDDDKTPRLDQTLAEFYGKDQKYTAPFTPPLAYFSQRGNTYAILYYPFAFQKRLKITVYDPEGLDPKLGACWYQHTYVKFPAGTPVESWQGLHVDSTALRTQWEQLGQNPLNQAGMEPIKKSVSVKKGETASLLDHAGQGSISDLKITLDPWTTETLFQTDLRITWDNHAPAVEMPIGCFFGAGGDSIDSGDLTTYSLRNLLFGFDRETKTMYSYWPMPFWSRARIEVVNRSPNDIALQASVGYKPSSVQNYPKETSGYFCAKRTVDIPPDEAYYSKAFRARGQGKVMGIMMYSRDYAMDGDEFTYIDGSLSPQIHGSGTEDDHNQGWGGYNVQKALWGGIFNGFNGGYRLYLNDAYIFNSGITINYEHSNAAFFRPEPKTDFVVWYYLADPGYQNLKLTDEVDVGNRKSERSHKYKVSRQSWSGETSSSYDRYEQGNPYPTKDDGRAFTGSCRFTVKIDPNNEGVRLRRRTNRCFSHIQLSTVAVDGAVIPDTPWYICDQPATNTAFIDSDFEIPAAYTKGKDKVIIEVRHVSGQPANSTNEYRYWVYSYGKTTLPSEPPETPTLFAKADDGSRSVDLTWYNPSDDLKGYEIERREKESQNFEKIGTLTTQTKSTMIAYRDADLKPLTAYVYRVRAIAEGGSSEWSEASAATGPAPTSRNLALRATASASSSWQESQNAAKANDGKLDTRWNSAMWTSAGEWLALDFGQEVQLDTVLFHQETTWTDINSYIIQRWENGAWEDIYEGRDMGGVAVCRFPATTTSRIRLLVKTTTGNTPTIREFEVYDDEPE